MVTPTYKSWSDMKYRCTKISHKDFANYGGRGITYDPRWEQYANFREDMGRRPEGRTLDRIDNNGNYCKANCKWSTSVEQNNNRRERIRGVERPDNTSGVPGVFLDKRRGTWYARGYFQGRAKVLVSGVSYEEACQVRLEHRDSINELLGRKVSS